MTNYELAIQIFDFIEDDFGVEDKIVADLGAGTGMLSIAALASGAQKVISVEMDEEVIRLMKENIEKTQVEGIEIVH